jgi:DNA-binding response OmpR family regulator
MKTRRHRILFVEDHQDTRELLVLVLGQENYEVITATNIREALALTEKESFDLFVFDSLLADGTGIDLCKRIRQTNRLTPILFYSALAYEKNKQEALNCGAQDYLVKPVSIPTLFEAVSALITSTPVAV